jgi:hypothetical protein
MRMFSCKVVYLKSVSCFSPYENFRIRPNGGCISVTACMNDNFLRLARGPPVFLQPHALQNLATWLIRR